MTDDRIREYIDKLRTQVSGPALDTLRRMEAELTAPPKKYYDATDPENPWYGTNR